MGSFASKVVPWTSQVQMHDSDLEKIKSVARRRNSLADVITPYLNVIASAKSFRLRRKSQEKARRQSSKLLLKAVIENFGDPTFELKENGVIAVQLVLSDHIARRALMSFLSYEHAEENVLFFEGMVALESTPNLADSRLDAMAGLVDK
jgi:hypothetical protein